MVPRRNCGPKKASGATAAAKSKFLAPSVGHGDVVFTPGSTKDAAEFKDTVQNLARHVLTTWG